MATELNAANVGEFKTILAFLVKVTGSNLMDRTPGEILEEMDIVDENRDGYLDTLNPEELKRFNAYISFHEVDEVK